MSKTATSMHLRKMCRGMGKIYALVDLPQQLRTSKLQVYSTLMDGGEVPAKLLPYDEMSRVLVLAVLDVTQEVRIVATDEDGNGLAVLTRKVSPQIAKTSSRVHTLLRDRDMERIRNYDALALFNEWWIDITRVVREPQGTDIVQATAVCKGDESLVRHAEIVIDILDACGNSAAKRSAVIMRDSVVDADGAPGCVRRDIQFSFAIDASLEEFVVWIRTNDPSSDAPQGFFAVEDHRLAWWREMWVVWMQPAQVDPEYTEKFDIDWKVSRADLEVQRRTKLGVNPKFSIIVPLFHTPLAYLDEMIESVLSQSYENLELILVNASVEDEELVEAVAKWALHDSRIVTVPLHENKGITENTNEGIRVATGDFLCFLDHDDFLSLDALYCYAKALEDYPETDLLYSDEDHYENGLHTCPYFKPDWNPDLLLGMNYICHFLAVRKSVVDELDLPTSEFDGAQDYHMAFRVSERARNIYHCRKVLYHWRVHPGSTASGMDEKPYAIEAGRLAIQAHLDRCEPGARAVHSQRMPNRYEVEYDLVDEPLVSILIPNKDAVPVLDRCLASIRANTDYQNYEVIIIENNSTSEETFAYYQRAEAEDSRVRVIYYEGIFNYARINNFGASFAHGDYLLMLNNDIEVITPHWMRRMVSLCSRKSTAIVGAKLLFPDDTIQHVGVLNLFEGPDHINKFVSNNDTLEMIHMMQDESAVTGACLMVKRSVFDDLGGLDESFEVDYNDVDFCWRVSDAGYLLVCDPSVKLYHYESVSRGFHTSVKSALRFEHEKALLRDKWPQRFIGPDPMGSPNFDQRSLHCKLK